MDDKEYRSLFNKSKARSPSINSSNYRSSSSSYLNHMNTGSSFNKYDTNQNIISSASHSSPINSYSTPESWNNNYYNYGASNNYSPSYSSTANSYLKKYDDDHSLSSKYGTKKNPQDDYSANYLSKPYFNQYNEKTTLPSKYETKNYRQDDYFSNKLFNKNPYYNKDNEESSIASKYGTQKYRNEDFTSSFLHTTNKYSSTDIGKSSIVNNSENKSDYFSKNPIVIANNDINIGKPVNKIESRKYHKNDIIQHQNVSKHEYNFSSDSSEVSDSQDLKHYIGEIIYVGKNLSPYQYLGKSGDKIVAINAAGNICYIPPDAIYV